MWNVDADQDVSLGFELPSDNVRPRRLRLGEALVAAGVITAAQLEGCLVTQSEEPPEDRRRLGDIVVDFGLATEDDIARGLAKTFGFEYVDPSACDVPDSVARRLPVDVARRLRAVPLAVGPTWVRVAVVDPMDHDGVDALRDALGVSSVSLAVSTPSAIELALSRFWPDSRPATRDEEPAEPARTPARRPVAPVAAGWEYRLLGDGLPEGHRGHVAVDALEESLDALGAEGWEAVGVHALGTGTAVLLKRRR